MKRDDNFRLIIENISIVYILLLVIRASVFVLQMAVYAKQLATSDADKGP